MAIDVVMAQMGESIAEGTVRDSNPATWDTPAK
jgi:hypothetical protein